MKCDWRERRITYYAIYPMEEQEDANGEILGNLPNQGVTYEVEVKRDNIFMDTIDYMFGKPTKFVYPAKSYAIAIVYSYVLAFHYGTTCKHFLEQADLLEGDPYFEPYTEANAELYDNLLEYCQFQGRTLSEWCQKTQKYCYKEFLLDEEGLKILP